MEIKGKVVAITGGGKGIGRAIAVAVAAKGGRIALLDLDKVAMAETQETISVAAGNAEVRAYCCNVTDENSVLDTFKQLVADFGALHGLVNNAGVLRDGQLVKAKEGKVVAKMSVEDFSLVVDVHMKGAFLCAREAATHMIEGGVAEGCLIGMSSASFRGNFGQSNYSAAKAGIIAMSRVWSKELARYNIRSMAIAPGTIETDMLRSMPEEAKSKMASQVPLGRIGQPEHVAQTVVDILENDYLSGSVVEVSGGLFL